MERLRPFAPGGRDLLTWALVAFLGLTYLQVSAPDQVDLFLAWAREVAAGQDPYGEPAGYPPLAMFLMTVPEPFVGGVDGYRLWFAGGVLLASFAGLCVASHAGRRLGRPQVALAYVVGVGAMGTSLLLSRYDLLPAVCSLVALAAVLRGRSGPAWAALGIGIALKPYLLVLVPLLGVWELRRAAPAPGRRLAVAAAWVVVPSVVALLAMAPIAGLGNATQAYGFQASRAATQDATPALVVTALGFDQRPRFDRSCGCRVRDGAALGPARTVGTALVLLGVLALSVLLWRRPDARTLVVCANAALALLLLGSTVFSPQYLVWLAAPACLLAGTRAGWVAVVATAVATGAAAASYHLDYAGVILFTGPGRDLVVLRVAAQLVALAALLQLLRPPTRKPVHGALAVGSAPS